MGEQDRGPAGHHWKYVLGAALLFIYALVTIVLILKTIPETNKEILIAMTGSLATGLGIVFQSIFRNSTSDDLNAQTMNTLSQKAPPPTVPPENVTPPTAAEGPILPDSEELGTLPEGVDQEAPSWER